ncbi:MAG: hypothetical protein F6J87_19685 [Spirulina sp. SIO3F2]|nr:hypothetical protein [Spirulina sp. SIO3F2]
MSNDSKRLLITISDYDERMLTFWAKLHGKPKSTYAGHLVAGQIEAKAPAIRTEMEYVAKTEGISVEELESRWLGEADSGD